VAIEALQQIAPEIEIERADAGWEVFQQTGCSVPEATFEALRRCGAGLFGAVSSPSRPVAGYRSAILQMRQTLDLYANIRPIEGRWGVQGRRDIRCLIVRENTEDLYVQRERRDGDVAIAERQISRNASFRIGTAAARVAQRYGLRRITIVHKANILPVTDGLFRDSVREAIVDRSVGGEDLKIDEMLVDMRRTGVAGCVAHRV
jgi:homoisocitrate dehydrogenase